MCHNNEYTREILRLAIIDVLNYIFKWNEDKEIISIKRERLPTRVSSGELRCQLIISNCPSTKCTICRQAVIYKLEAMRGKEHSGPHFSSQTKPFSSLKAWEGTLHFLSLAYISQLFIRSSEGYCFHRANLILTFSLLRFRIRFCLFWCFQGI